jgi:anti-sigma B factor antagonist
MKIVRDALFPLSRKNAVPLTVQSRRVGYVTVVDCRGRLVAGEDSEALNKEVKRCIENHLDVVVNLKEVSFIDSSGLGMLVRLVSTTRNAAASLRFCGASEQMLKVLELTKLSDVLTMHGSESQAIEALGSRSSAQPAASSGAGTILCLDQSMDLLAYLRESLERAGFKTQSARTIPDSILLIRTIRPSMVISGPQFASKVVGITAELHIPTITLSEEFCTTDAGEAIEVLLDAIRSKLEKGNA